MNNPSYSLGKLAAAVLFTSFLSATAENTADATIFVATNGNDSWSGRLAAPNADKTDGPVASISAAIVASRKQAETPRKIIIGDGSYYTEQTLILNSKDSELTIEGGGPGKTIIYGGKQISNWQKDGEHFWTAEVPGVKEGKWDFRALVVNDRLCMRARLPETGRFEHETKFPVRWMSSAGGGWERKPTKEELITMQYRAGDLGNWLSPRNAEVTVYHMWDESMVGVASHDADKRILTFSTNCIAPPGAFGVNTYVVWNVREGMKSPGQWYLDRDSGRIVYWPLPNEDMSKALVVAPCVETIIEIQSNKQKPAKNITLRSLTLSATTTPCKPGGFGASQYRGAIHFNTVDGIRILNVEITNIAGNAIREWGSHDLHIEDCNIHHIGAGACQVGSGDGLIANNRINYVGLLYPSAIAMTASGKEKGYTIRRNEIHHTPYSGMSIGGVNIVVEENLIHHCMQELHDGAAIYGGAKGAIIRRNVVRDIIEVGKGYGVSSYYMDEKSRDCIVENNVSIGVKRPCHNHMTLNCVLRNNVFISDGDMDISFARSSGGKVTGNMLHLNGKLKINDPDGIVEWSSNLIVQAGETTPTISDAMPVEPRKPREKPIYGNVTLITKPPVIDGKLDGEEWPSGGIGLGELPDQRRARGAPVMAKLCTDTTNLYIGITTVSMFPEDRKLGTIWGKDESIEIAMEGKKADGQPVTYVLRGLTDGKLDSLSIGGASESEAKSFAGAVKYAAMVDKQLWRAEWSIPLSALRFTPVDKANIPMNITVYRSEDNQFVQWAGTLGETWDLKHGGRLSFSKPK